MLFSIIGIIFVYSGHSFSVDLDLYFVAGFPSSHPGYYRFLIYLFKKSQQLVCMSASFQVEEGWRQAENWPPLQGRLLKCRSKESFTLWHDSVAHTVGSGSPRWFVQCFCLFICLFCKEASDYFACCWMLGTLGKTLAIAVIEFVFFIVVKKTQHKTCYFNQF